MSKHVFSHLTPSILLPMLLAVTLSACVEPEDNDEDILIIESIDNTDMSGDTQTDDMSEDDMEPGEDDVDMADIPAEPTLGCEGNAFSGEVFFDHDLSSTSRYSLRRDDTDELLKGENIILYNQDFKLQGTTCDNGTFGASNLHDGNYVFGVTDLDGRISASSSQGVRFIEAVKEGNLNVVVFGDSIPAYGPAPWYPEYLEQTLDTVVDTDVANIAIPGTRSVDWLPGVSNYYEENLFPRIADADVIIFSLGGNDLYELANGSVDTSDPSAAIAQFDETVEEVISNLKLLITAIRNENPNVDIVWMLYPNYATTERWAALAPDLIGVIEGVLAGKLNYIRRELAHHEKLIMWDINNATKKLDLDAYLSDELHLNKPGHILWSQELFLTLGGVIIENGISIEAEPREIGLGNPLSMDQ